MNETISVPLARTVGFQPGERNVFLHLLTACNLHCRHCYINPPEHGTNMLSLDTVRQWLALFARPAQSGQASNLILLGGEPTLHPDLAAIIRLAKSLRYAVTVDSNGYLFHDLLEKTTPQELDYLSFSLDGPEAAANDPIRGTGSFQVCTENIRRAVAKGFQASLICTVSALNIRHIARMPALAASLGIKRLFLQVIGLRGKPAAGAASAGGSWQVQPEDWFATVPQVAMDAAARGLHVVYPKVYLEETDRFECAGTAAENYFVFPNGRVYRCPLCEDFPIHSLEIAGNALVRHAGLNEDRFFALNIPEGCVMNRLLQPDNIGYDSNGRPLHRISCCLLKQEILPAK